METSSGNGKISRRAVLGGMLATGGLLVAGGLLRVFDRISGTQSDQVKPSEDVLRFEGRLEETLGPDWKRVVARQVLSVDEDPISGQNVVHASILGRLLTNESFVNSVLSGVRIKLMAGDNPVVQSALTGSKDALHLYSEVTKGGSVTLGPDGRWVKLITVDSGANPHFEYYKTIWNSNLASWQVPERITSGYVDLPTGTGEGKQYWWFSSPDMGVSLEKSVIAGEIDGRAAKELVLGWFDRTVGMIREGNYDVVHTDCHPGNLGVNVRSGVRQLLPMDLEGKIYAYGKPEDAVSHLVERIKHLYSSENLSRRKMPEGMAISEEDLLGIIRRQFPDYNINLQDLRRFQVGANGTKVTFITTGQSLKDTGFTPASVKQALDFKMSEVVETIPANIEIESAFSEQSRALKFTFKGAGAPVGMKDFSLKVARLLAPVGQVLKYVGIALDAAMIFGITANQIEMLTEPIGILNVEGQANLSIDFNVGELTQRMVAKRLDLARSLVSNPPADTQLGQAISLLKQQFNPPEDALVGAVSDILGVISAPLVGVKTPKTSTGGTLGDLVFEPPLGVSVSQEPDTDDLSVTFYKGSEPVLWVGVGDNGLVNAGTGMVTNDVEFPVSSGIPFIPSPRMALVLQVSQFQNQINDGQALNKGEIHLPFKTKTW